MALGGRRFWKWDKNADPSSLFHRWDANQCVTRFGLKQDEHIAITQVKAIQTLSGETGVQQLFGIVDRSGVDHAKLVSGVLAALPIGGIDEANHVGWEKVFWCVMDGDNFADVDRPNEPIEVYESILWVKNSAAAEFTFMVDFVYLDKPMRWPVEDHIKDLRVIPRERTAGQPFFQAGDQFRVIGENI